MAETRRPLQVAVISHLYPSRTRENYGVFVYEQCRALVDYGCDLTAIAVPVPWAPWPLPLLSATWSRYSQTELSRVDFGGVFVGFPRYLSLPRKTLRGVSARSAVRSIAGHDQLAGVINNANVLVAHTALLDGAIARSIASRLGLAYVVVVHGEDLYQNASADKPRLRSQVESVLRAAHTVIAVSSIVRDGLSREFPGLERIVVLPNGVDTDLFTPAERLADGGTPFESVDSEPLHVLSAGHLVTRKAHRFVLHAIAGLVNDGLDIRYTIAGDGPLRASLEALSVDLGIDERVTFSGAYRHEDLAVMLREADLFALPSWNEAFGVVYLEALACGVPVVAASDGGATGFVTPGLDGFLVTPRDSDEIAAAILTFAGLRYGERAAMSAAARTKALNYTWRRNAEGLVDALSEVVAHPAPPCPRT